MADADATTGAPARRVALEVLARVEDEGAYANLALSPALDRSGLGPADRAFVTDLVYGSLRRRRSCDHLVDRFLSSPPPPAARRALRLGAYQLAYRDDVPDYAAVAATVAASPKRFRALVNAVLRKVASQPVEPPDDGTRLSYPDWILERLRSDLGSEVADAALEAMNEAPTVHVRDDGYTQDLGSQLVVEAVGAQPGERIVDLCAAPGGKATGLGAAGAFVVAADLQPQRVALMARNIARVAGAASPAPTGAVQADETPADDVVALVADASAPPVQPASMDRVLLDAPCSGLGVLHRRADARWRIEPTAVERLSQLQRRLVDAAVGLVAPGGVLVYSVCTMTRAETLDVDDHLARHHPDLEPLAPPPSPWTPWGRGALLLPQAVGSDGMFVARYRRRGPTEPSGDSGTMPA
jgi:16S rRNA (cytosine967-C5)-methyltransferase